jgi:broad-specificity NMP kinase
MPLVCPRCGAHALTNAERAPDSTRCAACGASTPANVFPLFVVTGASGAGKTTVVPALRRRLPECVVFDKDLLWGRGTAEQFTNNWLRIAYAVAQCGRHAVICGTIMPGDVDACEDRGLVGAVHFLNLHCGDEVRGRRLRARPPWRGVDDEYVVEHERFARWLLESAATRFDPAMPTVDTSDRSAEEVADAVGRWVERVLAGRCVREPSDRAPGA